MREHISSIQKGSDCHWTQYLLAARQCQQMHHRAYQYPNRHLKVSGMERKPVLLRLKSQPLRPRPRWMFRTMTNISRHCFCTSQNKNNYQSIGSLFEIDCHIKLIFNFLNAATGWYTFAKLNLSAYIHHDRVIIFPHLMNFLNSKQ